MSWHDPYIKMLNMYHGPPRYQRGKDGVEFTEFVFPNEAVAWWLRRPIEITAPCMFADACYDSFKVRFTIPRDEWELQDYLIIAKYEMWYHYNLTHHSNWTRWLDDRTFKDRYQEFLNELARRIVNSNEDPLTVFFEYTEEYFEGEMI